MKKKDPSIHAAAAQRFARDDRPAHPRARIALKPPSASCGRSSRLRAAAVKAFRSSELSRLSTALPCARHCACVECAGCKRRYSLSDRRRLCASPSGSPPVNSWPPTDLRHVKQAPNINPTDEPNPPLTHAALCLKSSDDGHCRSTGSSETSGRVTDGSGTAKLR
jgi:hypothetical protein